MLFASRAAWRGWSATEHGPDESRKVRRRPSGRAASMSPVKPSASRSLSRVAGVCRPSGHGSTRPGVRCAGGQGDRRRGSPAPLRPGWRSPIVAAAANPKKIAPLKNLAALDKLGGLAALGTGKTDYVTLKKMAEAAA